MLTLITTSSSKIDLNAHLDNLSKEAHIKPVIYNSGTINLPLVERFKKQVFHEKYTIFIENIECGLHPRQQRELLRKILEIQGLDFYITTFSPIVISECPRESVRVLFLEGKEIKEYTPNVTLGLTSDEVLNDVLGD